MNSRLYPVLALIACLGVGAAWWLWPAVPAPMKTPPVQIPPPAWSEKAAPPPDLPPPEEPVDEPPPAPVVAAEAPPSPTVDPQAQLDTAVASYVSRTQSITENEDNAAFYELLQAAKVTYALRLRDEISRAKKLAAGIAAMSATSEAAKQQSPQVQQFRQSPAGQQFIEKQKQLSDLRTAIAPGHRPDLRRYRRPRHPMRFRPAVPSRTSFLCG